MRGFELFLDLERWWPIATHDIAEPAGESAVLEPFVGGRWYERSGDGNETDWGRVLAFDLPCRILLTWLVGSDWNFQPDPARASEIEIGFLAEGPGRTRVLFEPRHLERYGEQSERMRAVLDRSSAVEAVLRAFQSAVSVVETASRGVVARAADHD